MFFIIIIEGEENGKWYEGSWQVLFDQNYKRVYKTAVLITLDTELAQDITQEAFYRALSQIDTLKDKNKFGIWIRSIAINLSKDMLKRKIKDNNKRTSLYDRDGFLREDIFAHESDNPEKQLEKNEEIEQIVKYIDELSSEEQQIIHLKFFEELSYVQIAEILDMKEGTVRMKALRAKDKILNKLNSHMNRRSLESNGR